MVGCRTLWRTSQLRDFHRPRIELLLSAEPDLLAVETIPDIDEAAVLADLIDEYDATAWLSYTIAALAALR